MLTAICSTFSKALKPCAFVNTRAIAANTRYIVALARYASASIHAVKATARDIAVTT